MLDQLSLSIIVPFYNAKNNIKNCLDVLSKLNFEKPFEIILIDDASKDNGREILKIYKSLNIQLYILDINSGPSAARNVGISKSKGKYLYFLDVDDTIDLNTFKVLFNVLNEDDYDLVFSDKKWIEKSKNQRHNVFDYPADKVFNNIDLNKVMWTRFSDPMSAGKIFGLTGRLMKRSLIIDNKILFEEKLRYLEDDTFGWDFLAHVSKARYVRNQLYNYHIYPNLNTASSEGIKRGFSITNFKIVKEHIEASLKIRKFSDIDANILANQGFIFLLIGALISYSRSIILKKVDSNEGLKHLELLIRETLSDEDVSNQIRYYSKSKDESFIIPLAIKVKSHKLLKYACIRRAKKVTKIRRKNLKI